MPTAVRVLILYNPISGSGQSARLVAALSPVLEDAELPDGTRIDLACAETRPEPASEWLDVMLEGVDLLVVVGGDGAMRLVAESAIRAKVAVVHYPAGTENLFAREFGMKAEPTLLLEAICGARYQMIDAIDVDGRIALLCASIGLDADIAHDLAEHRSGAIRHSSYVRPILRQLSLWRRKPPRFTVEVDGEHLVESSPGFVLVANTRQYAVRLDPAHMADPRDGLLDVVHLRARSVVGLLIWVVRCRLRRQFRHRDASHAQGRRIVVRAERPAQIQIDGDALDEGVAAEALVAVVRPGALRVLCP